jgi:photosystem II stability/assembly factor-like uncharacterized protein
MFVAVGEKGTALTSPDGVDWTIRPTGCSSMLSSITWTGSKLVATGYNEDVVLTSENGISWTTQNKPDLDYVNWIDSKLVGVGFDDLYFSEDGENWVKQDVNWTIGKVNSFFWTGKEYITAGDIGKTPAICISYNAYVWRNMLPDTQEVTGYLQSIATNGKTIVAVGSNGLIFTCESDMSIYNKTSSSHFNQTHEKLKSIKRAKSPRGKNFPDSFGKKNVFFKYIRFQVSSSFDKRSGWFRIS